jgi:hypothetical protein
LKLLGASSILCVCGPVGRADLKKKGLKPRRPGIHAVNGHQVVGRIDLKKKGLKLE